MAPTLPKNVTVTKDKTAGLLKSLAALAESRVYAGVPATTAGRRDEDTPINNAELMFIHENGAPEANIPARPVVHPAIKSIQGPITSGLRATGVQALNGNVAGVAKGYAAVGLLAQNAMRKRITDGPFAPLSPRTIAARAAQRGTKRRKGEKQYLDLVASGSTPAAAQSAAGIKPLINTAQLRAALTYVVRAIKWPGKKTRLG